MCICMAPEEVKDVVIEELYHWKKCDKRKEVSRFDIFSGLILERKEYRSLLHYRFNRGGKTPAEDFVPWDGNALY